jgi:threonine/homoserine/homoserine lactone efflux protein
MSRLARVLILGTVMAAMNLAGMTAVAQAQSAHDDAVQRFRQGERASQEQPTTDEVVQRFRQGERASQEQPTTDNPAPLQPDQPTGQPGWLVVSLAMLAATLAVVAGLAVLAARRANHRARIGPAT